jgi:transcriptional regulator with XRE-family HTH domain
MNAELGRKIRVLRIKRNMTQADLGFRTGISTPHISSIERGQRQPSLEYAVRLAEALGVPIGYFAEGAELTNLPEDTSYGGPSDLPGYLQSFVAREEAQQYIAMAHRVSRLTSADYDVLCSLIDMMMQRKRLVTMADELV